MYASLQMSDRQFASAQQYFERYTAASDPWLRAVGKVYLASYAISLGQLDGAEETCRAGLAELRGLVAPAEQRRDSRLW